MEWGGGGICPQDISEGLLCDSSKYLEIDLTMVGFSDASSTRIAT